MHPLIQSNREQLTRLCQRHHVQRLDVFGSATTDRFNERTSDLDFVVEFEPMPPLEHGKAYWALRDDLLELFGRPVDLIERQTIQNPHLRNVVMQSQVRLYDAA